MRVVPVSSLPAGSKLDDASMAKPHAVVCVNGDSDQDDDSDRDSVPSSGFYCSLSHASSGSVKAPARPRRRGCSRVLYAYPRLCFALVLLASAFGTGAYSAYFLALRMLDTAGVRHALATSRAQLVATEITMRRAAACALSGIPSRAASLRAQVEQGLAPWQEKVDAFEALLDTAQANITQCAMAEIDRLERLVASNGSESAATASTEETECVLDAVQSTVVRYASPSLSGSLFWKNAVGRVKRVVKTARAERVFAQLAEKSESEKDKVLALATNASSGILAVMDVWMEDLERAVEEDLEASILGELRLPPLPISAGIEALSGLMQEVPGNPNAPFSLISRQQLLGALRSIAGVSRDVSRAVDAFEQTFNEISVFMRSLDERESKVRQELAELQNATQTHVRESLTQLKSATVKLRAAIGTQTRSSINAFAAAIVDMFDLDHQHGLDDAWKQLLEVDNDLIPRDIVLHPEEKPWKEHVELAATFDSLTKTLKPHNTGIVEQDTHRDALMFRASLYDASAVFVTIILTWDFLSRLGWFLGKLARLLTESYSDLPAVDIRDNASITTLIDVWGVLKCRHDLGSIVFAIMTEGSYVLETAIHFVLWVLLEVAGTLALIAWNRAILDRCRSKSGQLDVTVTTPSTLWIYIQTWLGDSSVVSLAPVAVVTKQTDRLEKALDEDERAWRKQVDEAARTHSKQVDGLMLEKRFLLDVRENLASCLIEPPAFDDSGSESQTLFMPVEQLEPVGSWASDATDAFRHERVKSAINAEVLVAECLARNNQANPTELVQQLDHAHSCLLDQTLYLAVASWWMVLVIILALRLTARMVTKSAGMVFWRYLSADRLEVLVFSDQNGAIQSPDRLPKAIRRHLRNIRWRVAARMFGVLLGFVSVMVIGLYVLPPHIVRPLE